MPAQSQVGTPKHFFNSRAEVEAAARKHKLNLRESYNIIMCAKRQGMIRSVVRAYEQELPSNPFNTTPQLASSFALAHELMTASVRWDWKRDRQRGLTQITSADGLRITLYRDRALQALPNSPEVLLNHAIWALKQDKREEALNLVNKALRFAPNWAELNWWHAKALDYRLMAMSMVSMKERARQEPRYGPLILRALAKAERLDPAFKQENFISRAYAYAYSRRYKDALEAYDAYIRYKPGYRQVVTEDGYLATRKEWTEQAKRLGQL